MACDGAQVESDTTSEHIISPSAAEEELQDAVRALPTSAVKDLLSLGACVRCILRFFKLHEKFCHDASLSTPVISSVLGKFAGRERHIANGNEFSQEVYEESKVCKICLGVLQFMYNDETGTLVRKDCPRDFAARIAELVKQEGHQIDSFSLEVSLPQLLVEREQAIWLYMKSKYKSELGASDCISAKDVLKLSITNTLETLLGVKSNQSSFRIRLTYMFSETSTARQDIENNGCNKRRKTGSTDELKTTAVPAIDSDVHKAEISELSESSSLEFQDGVQCLNLHLEKVSQPCSLAFQCYRNSIYIGGRYLKYSRNVSQTRWIIDDERMGDASVEEIIGSNILPACQGDNYKFHAAGREDIDVRMLGTGRPFLVEIQNARLVPSELTVKEIEMKINHQERQYVGVKNLKVLGSEGWALMREGEAEKQKQYCALVWISRPLIDDDLDTISALKDMKISQRMPVRVLHRRSPLEREKIIHWMKIERIRGSSQYFLLHLCTQAGTYIKEFVHGDLGRTHPSFGSVLQCRAEILQLDVTDVKMECFQAE